VSAAKVMHPGCGHRVGLFHGDARRGLERLHVAARHEQIFPAVVVEIGDGRRVSGHGQTEPLHVALPGKVGELEAASAARLRKMGANRTVAPPRTCTGRETRMILS